MTIYQRLAHVGSNANPTAATRFIPNHPYHALVNEIQRGKLSAAQGWTKMASLPEGEDLTFTGVEKTKLSDMRDVITAVHGDCMHSHDAWQLAEAGWYTVTEAKTSLGV